MSDAASASPRCSIVIPVHDGAELTRACLEALLAQEPANAEIVVVDDASSDTTPELLAGYGARIAVVTLPDNRGFAAASNAGAEAARGELIVFLNNDTIPQPGWLEALVSEADANPEATAVGAKLLWPDGIVQHAGVVIAQGRLPHHVYQGFPGDHRVVNVAREFPAVTAACMLVRREAFVQAGGFDTSYHNGYEDIDLCLKLREAGGAIRYCPQAVVHHLESATRGKDRAGDAANLARLHERWGERLVPDDLERYVADGMIELHYSGALHPIGIRIDPLLASVVAEGADNRLQWLLNTRTQQVFELLDAARRAAPVAPPATDGADGLLRAAELLERRIAPLRLNVSPREPVRLNVLVPALGGDGRDSARVVALVQLLRRLRDRHRIRILLLEDPLADDASAVRARVEGTQALHGALEQIELATASDRNVPVVVHPDDRFIAIDTFAAHVAHAAGSELGRPRFLALLEDEDGREYPSSSWRAVAEQALAFPQVTAFASAQLREQFAARGLGVFAAGRDEGERHSIALREPLLPLGPVTPGALAQQRAGRLLLDGGDLTELALLALRRALREGVLPGAGDGVHVTAIGDPDAAPKTIGLGARAQLELVPRPRLVRYQELLAEHGVGLALAHSANLGGAPLAMAASGMLVVATTYGAKDAERLAALSANVIPVAPTPDGIVDGLRSALARVGDHEARVAAADVARIGSWDEALDEATLASVERLLELCAADA